VGERRERIREPADVEAIRDIDWVSASHESSFCLIPFEKGSAN
jgi:hypothetical protein